MELAPVGSAVGPSSAPPATPLLVQPVIVLVTVLAAWVLVPSVVAPPKVVLALTLGQVGLVINALWWHRTRLHPTAPVVLLATVVAVGALSSWHDGTLLTLVSSCLTGLLLVGCCLLATHLGSEDVERLARLLVLLALAETVVAAASTFAGVPAPWGYLGRAGTTFGINELLPALPGRATGTLGHPIPFATVLAVAATLAVTTVRRWSLAVRLVAALACAGGVLLSGSRSAALALVLALLLALLVPGVLSVGPAGRSIAVLAAVITLVVVDVTALPAVTSLEGTGSVTHRLGALQAVGRLAGRPLDETLFGSGEGSLKRLFAEGLLQVDGFLAVDNQVVTTFAVAGLTGALALIAAVVIGLLRGARSTRPAAALLVVMFFSFDVLEWRATAVLFAVLVALGERARRNTPDAGGSGGPRPAVASR